MIFEVIFLSLDLKIIRFGHIIFGLGKTNFENLISKVDIKSLLGYEYEGV